MKVFFSYANGKKYITQALIIRKFVEGIFKTESKKIEEVNYIFCSDDYLLEINQQFLFHNFYTDIISFDLSDSNLLKAEIYISIDRVKKNSVKFSQSFKTELLRVIIHGALHFCEYNDKISKQQAAMRLREDFYIQKFLSKNS